MSKSFNALKYFILSEDGPTAIEYAVLVGLIIIALIGVLQMVSGGMFNVFVKTTDTLNAAAEK